MMSLQYGSRRMLLVLLVLFGLTVQLPVSWAAPEYRAVTILHTNDTHGHLIPFDLPDPRGAGDETASMPHITDIGGIARRATLARRIGDEMSGRLLFMDAGDALDGTPFSIEYMGEADFAAMSAAGYDIMTPGNHEFSASIPEFRRTLNLATFEVVSANLIDRSMGDLALPPYKIFEFDGAKIAVFGLTVPNTYRAAKEGFDFKDPIEAAASLVPVLKERADIVIALSHIGIDEDKRLAREVPGIDVIVGGHSHTRLAEPVLIRHSDLPQAFWVGGTVIVQTFWWGGELGRLDLRLRRNNGPFTLMSYSGRLLPVTSDIEECPATAKVVEKYYRPLQARYGEVVGQAASTFYNSRESRPNEESAMLNLICDAFRECSGADIGIYNTGGVRGELTRGPIKAWDIATVLPFMNRLVEFEITGEYLKQSILKEKPGVSGMRYRISKGELVEATIDGRPIQDDKLYKVATIDFLLGQLFTDVQTHKVLKDDYRSALIEYIKARKTVSPVEDGRRIVD